MYVATEMVQNQKIHSGKQTVKKVIYYTWVKFTQLSISNFLNYMMKKNGKMMVAWVLVLIGALNWGLVGIGNLLGHGNWDVVDWIFVRLANVSIVADLIYLVVGIAAIVAIVSCSKCHKGGSGGDAM